MLTLEVRASNAAAIALYRSCGLGSIGRRPNYYRQPPEDALLLARAFDSGGKGMAPPVFIDEPHVEPPQLEMLMQSSGAAAPIIRRAGNTTEAREEEEQPPEITPLGELLGVIPPP